MGVMSTQYGYGVCIDYIKEHKLDKLTCLIKTKFAEMYKIITEDTPENELTLEDIMEWIGIYEGNNGGDGLNGMLADIIVKETGISINAVSDDNGFDYLLLWESTPWGFNEKTRALTEDEFCNIIRKYINMVTDEELEVKLWPIESWD